MPIVINFFCPSVVEQCLCNRIKADDMVSEWVAYSTTKNGIKLSMDTLEQFEHEVTGAFRNFPLVFLLSCRIQIFLILFSVQVLNRKNTSKHRKEDSYVKTRDIHFLQDLYLSQRTYHCVCFGCWMFGCCVSALDIISPELKQRRRRRIFWIPTRLLLRWAVSNGSFEMYGPWDKFTRCVRLCAQGSQKRALTTPEHPHSKRSAALLASPGLLLSPASFSPRYLATTLWAMEKKNKTIVVCW